MLPKLRLRSCDRGIIKRDVHAWQDCREAGRPVRLVIGQTPAGQCGFNFPVFVIMFCIFDLLFVVSDSDINLRTIKWSVQATPAAHLYRSEKQNVDRKFDSVAYGSCGSCF